VEAAGARGVGDVRRMQDDAVQSSLDLRAVRDVHLSGLLLEHR
jgi:hypothetical protein